MADMDIAEARTPDRTFVLDADYLRREAHEGALTFLAPLIGLYRAVRGGPAPAQHAE